MSLGFVFIAFLDDIHEFLALGVVGLGRLEAVLFAYVLNLQYIALPAAGLVLDAFHLHHFHAGVEGAEPAEHAEENAVDIQKGVESRSVFHQAERERRHVQECPLLHRQQLLPVRAGALREDDQRVRRGRLKCDYVINKYYYVICMCD